MSTQNETNKMVVLYVQTKQLMDALWVSAEVWDEDKPQDLTVVFNYAHFAHAMQILRDHPESSSVRFEAKLTSSSFEGKIKDDYIEFNRCSIYAGFREGWSNTHYVLPIDSMLKQEKNIEQWSLPSFSEGDAA